VRLAADANVLLSAVLGGRAKTIPYHPKVSEVLTTTLTLDEVQEYAAELARKKRLALDAFLMAVATLPLRVTEYGEYERCIPRARALIGKRDPDDVEILALALCSGCILWSNDNDFSGVGVAWHTTAELLARLRAEGDRA